MTNENWRGALVACVLWAFPGLAVASSPPIYFTDLFRGTFLWFPLNLLYVPILVVAPAFLLRQLWNMVVGGKRDYRYIGGNHWVLALLISAGLATCPIVFVVLMFAAW